MNQNDPLIRQLEAYLVEYEGPTPLPDTVRDAVRAQLPTTKQTGSISGPVRDIYMNSSMDTPARWGLVAAVVIGAVIIGGALFFGGGGVGSPPDATPSPSVEPSDAAPSAESSAPAGLPEGPHVLQDGDGDNAFDNVPMTVTIPAPGWNGDPAGGLLVKNEGDPDGALIGAWAGIEQMYVYGDPCDWATTVPGTPATTVDEAIAALAAQASRDASAPVDITLDGYAGKAITLHTPDDANFTECDEEQFAMFGATTETDFDSVERFSQAPGQIDEVWIVDVDGQMVLIDWAYYTGTPQEVVDEARAIVESTTFE